MPSTSDPAVSICTDARSRWRLATWGENSPPICLLSPTWTAAAAAAAAMMLMFVVVVVVVAGPARRRRLGKKNNRRSQRRVGFCRDSAGGHLWPNGGLVGAGGWWGGWIRERRRTPSDVAYLLHPRLLACPLSCTLLTSRAVTGLSEPITGRHAVCQPRTSLDRMTSNFWCWVSRTIWKQMSSLLVRRARHKYKLCKRLQFQSQRDTFFFFRTFAFSWETV